MRVDQLVLPLVRPAHQTAPGSVQLTALVLDVLHSLWVGLDQTLGCLPERVDLSREGARSVPSTAHSERGRATQLLGPCLLEQPGLSRSPRVCAVAPARWPGHGRSCLCSEPGSSLLSILSFHRHLCGHKHNKKKCLKEAKEFLDFLDGNSASCSGPSPSEVEARQTLHTPVEALHLVGAAQHVAAFFCELLQGAPAVVQLLQKPAIET